ncbi:hypothetical protein WICPIJ_003195 [Wickerhamomyces pijperi]|uniref:Uncharacterized protein n=1 Tax=Wickerhamomyces pijperi TaxID=599730 RepID=A0A9P8TPG8_WICPI|nr:hypothetical protein WICPIJ_003195 [Wickerhamomyces pijperi]
MDRIRPIDGVCIWLPRGPRDIHHFEADFVFKFLQLGSDIVIDQEINDGDGNHDEISWPPTQRHTNQRNDERGNVDEITLGTQPPFPIVWVINRDQRVQSKGQDGQVPTFERHGREEPQEVHRVPVIIDIMFAKRQNRVQNDSDGSHEIKEYKKRNETMSEFQ